jgi:hypothetical protein
LSAWAWFVFAVVVLVGLPVCTLVRVVTAPVDPGRYATGLVFRKLAVVHQLLNPLWRFTTSGSRPDDPRHPYVVVSNHESFVDMLLISHLRRPQGDKGHEDGGKVSLGQLRGSHAIVQLSDIVIALERNLSAGDDESNLVVLKNRFNGRTGPAGVLCYNTETGRQTEILAATFNSLDSSEEEPF